MVSMKRQSFIVHNIMQRYDKTKARCGTLKEFEKI
jgi:hypothetical protein